MIYVVSSEIKVLKTKFHFVFYLAILKKILRTKFTLLVSFAIYLNIRLTFSFNNFSGKSADLKRWKLEIHVHVYIFFTFDPVKP